MRAHHRAKYRVEEAVERYAYSMSDQIRKKMMTASNRHSLREDIMRVCEKRRQSTVGVIEYVVVGETVDATATHGGVHILLEVTRTVARVIQ